VSVAVLWKKWRKGRDRFWFVIGDYSPFRGPMMLIGGPYTQREARRVARWWVNVHSCGKATVAYGLSEIDGLPRYLFDL
jgi:hypothetical protein